MSGTKTTEYIGVKARIHQHDGLIRCPYLPPLTLDSGYVPLRTTSGEVVEQSPIKFVTRYDVDVKVCAPVSHVDIKVTVGGPSNAPEHPDIGDVWIEPTGDAFAFYIWDGDKWIEALSDTAETSAEEQDTPEKAYERAMRVLK